MHQPRERGERVAEELKLGLRLAAAKVGEGPRGVAEHGELGVLVELLQERMKRVLREHEIAALGGVARDVAEGPHRLLADVVGGRSEELDEDGDRSRIDDDAGVLGGSGRDVGERPRSLELELGERLALEKLDKVGHHASLDDLLDGGRALDGEELAEGGGGLDLDPGIVGLDALDHLGQALELCSRGGARVSARKRSEPAPFFACGGKGGWKDLDGGAPWRRCWRRTKSNRPGLRHHPCEFSEEAVEGERRRRGGARGRADDARGRRKRRGENNPSTASFLKRAVKGCTARADERADDGR